MSAPTPEVVQAPSPIVDDRLVVLPIAAFAWVGLGILFVAIRIWPIWGTPVGGAELVHLSGAWNAHAGVEDSRYIPTLFQAMAAGLFSFTTSEVPARLLSFAATATVPVAVWSLRHRLGERAALVALALLTFDAPSLVLGAESGAMGFDLAITAWLFAFGTRGGLLPWQWAVIAFAVSTAGPLAVPLAAALVADWLLRGAKVDWQELAWPAGGAVVGILLTTLRPGLGPDGLTIAPLDLFGAGYEQNWSTANLLTLTALTSWPLILAGAAGGSWRLYRVRRGEPLLAIERTLLLWGALALGWFVTSLPSHAVAPLAGVTIPAVLLAGPAIADLFAAIRRADWTIARYLVPPAAAAFGVIAFYIGDWAKLDRVGDTQDRLIVIGLALAILAVIGALAADRRTIAILGAMALPIAAAPMLIATSTVAFRAGDSPIPSPYSRASARDLRDIAVEAARDGGTIVIHPDLEDELTWPFRDSGTVVIASQVPADAAVVFWPGAGPAALGAPPIGFAAVEEEWALLERVESPAGFLDLARWYSDRYSLANSGEPVAVYIREGE